MSSARNRSVFRVSLRVLFRPVLSVSGQSSTRTLSSDIVNYSGRRTFSVAQDPLFREIQRVRQPWIWTLLALTSVPALVFGSVVGLLVVLTVAAFLYSIRLTTEVRTDGMYVRFTPIHRSFRRVPFCQIEQVERTEFGLLTYGGIGIRWTANTVAYMTTRGSGVKIDRENAKSVVIGSQETSELLRTIDGLY